MNDITCVHALIQDLLVTNLVNLLVYHCVGCERHVDSSALLPRMGC